MDQRGERAPTTLWFAARPGSAVPRWWNQSENRAPKAPKERRDAAACTVRSCLITLLAGTPSAPALEVKDRAKAPPGWWDASAPMAIPPEYFDTVLSADGLTLVDASKAPTDLRPQGPETCRLGDRAPNVHAPGDGPDPLGLWGDARRPLEGAAHVRAHRGRKAAVRNRSDRVVAAGDQRDLGGVPLDPARAGWPGVGR
jgi:hypothetical protein